jgi:hypothetical protein
MHGALANRLRDSGRQVHVDAIVETDQALPCHLGQEQPREHLRDGADLEDRLPIRRL